MSEICPVEGSRAETVKTRKPPASRRFPDGETRTRTRDTTIFSRGALVSESGRLAGTFVPSGDISGVRGFPGFAPCSLTLRPTAGLVGLFVLRSRDRSTTQAGDDRGERVGRLAPSVQPSGAAAYSSSVTHSPQWTAGWSSSTSLSTLSSLLFLA